MIFSWILLAAAAASPAAKPEAAYPALESCAAQSARNIAVRTRESATIVADAAIGACPTQEIAFAKTVFDAFPIDRTGSIDAQTTFDFRLARLKRQLIAVVLDERAKRGM